MVKNSAEVRSLLARRQFLKYSAAWSAGVGLGMGKLLGSEATTTQTQRAGFFTLGRRKDHWWLIDPAGAPFFTMGLNHIDPASLLYPENVE